MSNEVESKEVLNKCIKCKKSDVNLLNTKWETKTYIKGKKEKVRIKFSACESCFTKIEKFIEYEKFYYRNKGVCGACTWVVSWLVLILSILFSFMGPDFTIAAMGIVGAIVLFLPFIIMKIYKNSHSGNLHKHILINSSGILIVKSKKSSGETVKKINIIEVKQEKIKKVQEESYKFCPNCGSTIKTSTGFCKTCGKNLNPKK